MQRRPNYKSRDLPSTVAQFWTRESRNLDTALYGHTAPTLRAPLATWGPLVLVRRHGRRYASMRKLGAIKLGIWGRHPPLATQLGTKLGVGRT